MGQPITMKIFSNLNVAARLEIAWEQLKTSLWFVPATLSVGAVLLAFVALYVDTSALIRATPALWWLHSGDATDASDLMSTLLSSLITMTALAISITMVVLTLAANTLGPRLIRSFMGDRRTQLVLGLFIATIVYLLLVLRTISDGMPDEAVPHLGVSIGSGLALTCIFVLLFFVNHLARSIVADVVVQRLGDDLDRAIERLLPQGATPAGKPGRDAGALGAPAEYRLAEAGYVRAIDGASLIGLAKRLGARIEVEFRPGSHLVPGSASAFVHPSHALTPELESAIAAAVVVGVERTPTQDLDFVVRHLVEIALRALSPGINDPFTAIAVIDRLALSIASIIERGLPSGEHRDDDQVVRLTIQAATLDGFLATAFDQIRQAGESKPDILIRLLDVTEALLKTTRQASYRLSLLRHAEVVVGCARRNIADPHDLAVVEGRIERSIRAQASP